MATDRGSTGFATLEDLAVAELQARVAAFSLDPHAAMLARLGVSAIPRVAERDPALAVRLDEARERAESLAREGFDIPDEDAVLTALYLLDWCHPDSVTQLAASAEYERQRWPMAEYLLARYPDALDAPGAGPLAELPDWQADVLVELMRAILRGGTRPAGMGGAGTAAAPAAPPAAGRSVSLYETVIVHGTYAQSTTWWREQPGLHNFWAYIQQFCPSLYGAGHEFTWSGGNSDAARAQGARDFIDWWHNEGAPAQLQVIAHSHGCNVVYLACAMEPTLNIANLVALGAPARIEYPPIIQPVGAGARRIQRIHNIYSEHDNIQVLGSLGGQRGEGRTLADGSRITHYHVPWEDPATQLVRAGHSDLHEERVWQGNRLAARTLL